MQLKVAIAVALFVAVTSIAVGLWFSWNEANPDTRGWSVDREFFNDDYNTILIVRIDPKFAQKRSVYETAVTTLCTVRKHGNNCIVGFFLPGDDIPPRDLMPKWGAFKPLAMWWSFRREFMIWDCDRAGVEGSPPSALCGAAVKEAYAVALSLGIRQGVGEFCNWPSREDIPPTLSSVLEDMARFGRSDFIRSGYAEAAQIGRNHPKENGHDCSDSQAKLDNRVDEAVAAWRVAIGRRP
jgi:hypothetical protein